MRCGSVYLSYRMMRLHRLMIGAKYEMQGEITRTVSAEKQTCIIYDITSRNFRPVWSWCAFVISHHFFFKVQRWALWGICLFHLGCHIHKARNNFIMCRESLNFPSVASDGKCVVLFLLVKETVMSGTPVLCTRS
jgi:hypothetical protein